MSTSTTTQTRARGRHRGRPRHPRRADLPRVRRPAGARLPRPRRPRARQAVDGPAVDRHGHRDVGHADRRRVPLHRARATARRSPTSTARSTGCGRTRRSCRPSASRRCPRRSPSRPSCCDDLGDGRTRLEILSVVDVDGGAGRDDGQRHGGRRQRGLRRARRGPRRAHGRGRMIPTDPAEEHRAIAGLFADRVRGVAADGWDAQSPVADWRARDVVRHLVEWFPGVPGGRLRHQADARSFGRRGPGRRMGAPRRGRAGGPRRPGRPRRSTFAHPHLPEMPLPQAISQFYTNDVFMHTWDLARATGQDDRLDEARCQELYRRHGADGRDAAPERPVRRPRCPSPDDADWQTKLLGFIGRDPEFIAESDVSTRLHADCRGSRSGASVTARSAGHRGASPARVKGHCCAIAADRPHLPRQL